MNIDMVALEKARKSLQRGFDAEAYIVMALAENRLGAGDNLPNTYVDDNIKYMGKEFVEYMAIKEKFVNNKVDEKTLLKYTDEFLKYVSKILVEVRASASTSNEKEVISKFIQNLQNLLQ